MRTHRIPFYFIASYICLVMGCLLIVKLPQVPYNVIELFTGHNIFLSALLFAAILIGTFGIPVYLGYESIRNRTLFLASYPLWILLHAFVIWILLNYTVPTESIHDIVGSPILEWSVPVETPLRFIALFCIPSMILVGITVFSLELSVFRYRNPRGIQTWISWFFVLLPVTYYFVVIRAATDNLVELMADQGGFFAFLSLIGWIFISFVPGSYLGGVLAGVFGGWKRVTIFVVAGVALGFLLLYFGLEQQVHKYDQDFSALQFLLSANRKSLVSGTSLVARYVIMEAALIIVVCITQYPFWKLIANRLNDNPYRPLGV